MNVNTTKLHNALKFLAFPYGIIPSAALWYGVLEAIFALLKNCGFTRPDSLPNWINWASAELVLLISGVLGIILFLYLFTNTLPKGQKNRQNIYVLLSPEDFGDDKYIVEDFVTGFEKNSAGIDNINIIVPHILKRDAFNRKIKKYARTKQSFWDSDSWKKIHNRLHGALYITGFMSRRESRQKELFVFTLSVTVSFNDFNKELTPVLLKELKANFPSEVLIDKSFEFEQIKAFSSLLATCSQYVIGIAHLVSGNLPEAYKMHLDIMDNDKQSFFKLQDIKAMIHLELAIILRECKKFSPEYIEKCAGTMLDMFPDDTETLLKVSRCKIMMSTEEDYSENVKSAFSLISRIKINKDNRTIVYANRAYLYLLLGEYAKAEKEYSLFFSHYKPEVAKEIVEYCNEQIVNGTMEEKATARYVKVLMLEKIGPKSEDLSEEYSRAKDEIPPSYEYYHQKLSSMHIEYNKTSDRKKRKQKP